MNIAICEDDILAAQDLSSMIEQWSGKVGRRTTCDAYDSAEQFLFQWPAHKKYDLIFLDINMGKISGMQLAESIRQIDESMIIVFVTRLKGYLVHGYKVNTFWYLFKPIQEGDCFETLAKAQVYIDNKSKNWFVMQIPNHYTVIPLDEILYFESDAHYVIAHSKRGGIRFRERFKDINLPYPYFCQCHRAVIVNMIHVYMMNRDKVQLDDATVLPVSQTYWAALNQAFLAYHGKG